MRPLGNSSHYRTGKLFAFVLLLIFTASTNSFSAGELTQVRRAVNPPVADLTRKAAPRTMESKADDAAERALTAQGGQVMWSTGIAYQEGKIFNPLSNRYEKVRLRSYKSAVTNTDTPFVAPTIELAPGETLRITLNNQLPKDDPSCAEQGNVNIPHCFNSTNLHAHGLWVNPEGNSDNVFVRINPGVAFEYEYNIPADHPAGTYWYHPHLHGATAIQVASGMGGALIIRGSRLPSTGKTGDIDTLLRNADGRPFPERVVLFQQIPYACRDAAGAIKTDVNGVWTCDEGDAGEIIKYDDQFGPQVWRSSGRYTTLNGEVIPTFDGAKAGEIERWRLIHAGVRDAVSPTFRKMTAPSVAVALANVTAARTDTELETALQGSCAGEVVPQLSMATDGLTRSAIVPQQQGRLYPAYREDLLMVFGSPGIYCLIDGDLGALDNINDQKKSRKLLAFVEVGEGRGLGGLTPAEFVKARLIEAAQAFMPADMTAAIVADLSNGLRLTAFEPHDSLLSATVDAKQSLGFLINGSGFQIGSLDAAGAITGAKPYKPDEIDRTLTLGSTDEWELKSFTVGHPFHIHVNPFQIAAVLDANGNDVSGYEEGNTTPYARLKGAWKDTIFVTRYAEGANQFPYRVVLRTKYRRYIGKFVLHCHILDHEDQGMMQNVRIGLPDGNGGTVALHHQD